MPKTITISALCCVFLVSAVTQQAIAQEDFLFRLNTREHIVTVKQVLSVDTIKLENGDLVRLIGLKAPEVPAPEKKPVNEYGIIIKDVKPTTSVEKRAIDFARELLEGKTVRLEMDAQAKDDELVTLAYVFLPDGTFVNEELLREGYAWLKMSPLNDKYAERLRSAYQEARREKRGLQGQ